MSNSEEISSIFLFVIGIYFRRIRSMCFLYSVDKLFLNVGHVMIMLELSHKRIERIQIKPNKKAYLSCEINFLIVKWSQCFVNLVENAERYEQKISNKKWNLKRKVYIFVNVGAIFTKNHTHCT